MKEVVTTGRLRDSIAKKAGRVPADFHGGRGLGESRTRPSEVGQYSDGSRTVVAERSASVMIQNFVPSSVL